MVLIDPHLVPLGWIDLFIILHIAQESLVIVKDTLQGPTQILMVEEYFQGNLILIILAIDIHFDVIL